MCKFNSRSCRPDLTTYLLCWTYHLGRTCIISQHTFCVGRIILQENEKTKDVLIEQRFHRTIIGAKGEKIREIRDKYPEVQISFPDAGKKSDIVNLRGPREDVDSVYTLLKKLNSELVRLVCLACVNLTVCFNQTKTISGIVFQISVLVFFRNVQIAANFRVEVPIFKQFHKNVIGRGGATIKKVKKCNFSNNDVIVLCSHS